MISLFFGIILLALPFLAVILFKDKNLPAGRHGIGFVFVLFFSILFHVVLALVTQMLGIFYYGVVLGAVILADLILLFFIFKKIKASGFMFYVSCFKKLDWALVFVIIVGFLTLYQVHYNYTGKINIATDRQVTYHEVENMQYVYPYFSDEWYSVALIENSINNHSLLITNPFDNSFFLNLELFFHSFLAEIILILNLNPLTQYTLLSIFFNLLILVLVYLLLRISNLSKSVCAISALSLLYITCGANMPGMWNLIPFNMGIIMVLIMFIFISLGNFKMVFASSILGSLFYPPLFIFYLLGFTHSFLNMYKLPIQKILKFSGYLIISIILSVIIYLLLLNYAPIKLLDYIISRIFFVSYFAPFSPGFAIYNVILWPLILFAILGIYFVFKNKKWLFYQAVLGVVFWIIYLFTNYRFMIEFERIVVITSIIITIIAGFGIQSFKRYIVNIKYFYLFEIIILFLFAFYIPSYTARDAWTSLSLVEPKSKLKIFPKAPANNYLTNEDLRIFKNIKNAKFLSTPWKGTVIGTATNNYPVVIKEGTISMGKENIINDFVNADCIGKINIAENLKIDYVYLYDFNCPEFKEVDKSKEGFYLYKFNLDEK